MPNATRRYRTSRPRTIGWGGHWWEEKQWPGWAYYPGRGVAWLVRRYPRTSVWLAGLGILWSLGGAAGLTVFALVGCFYGAHRLGWVSRIAGRDPNRKRTGLDDLSEDVKQRLQLRKQWALACESARLLGTRTGTPPRYRIVGSDGRGALTVKVSCGPVGIAVADVAKQAERLSQVIGCREVVVAEDGTGTAKLTLHWRDPIGSALPLAALPAAPRSPDGVEPRLAYGIRQDGSPATVIATQSILIGGLTRKGKSNFVWALLADAIRQGMYVDLYASDPKGGVELDALETAMNAVSELTTGRRLVKVRAYAKTPEETVEMVQRAERGMKKRTEWMKANGVRKIIPDKTNPLVVVLLDETLPLNDLLKEGTRGPLGRIAYTGAASAYVVWANTQVGQIDSIGRFRDLLPQRVCFATGAPTVTDSVLGTGAESMGARCSGINEPGVGYSYSEGDQTYRKFRAAMVSDQETQLIAMGQLPAKVANAAREAYDRADEPKSRTCRLYRIHAVSHPEWGDSLMYVGTYDDLTTLADRDPAVRAFMEGETRRTVVGDFPRKAAAATQAEIIDREKPIFNRTRSRVSA